LKIRHLAPKTFGRLQFKALAAGHSLTEVSALNDIRHFRGLGTIVLCNKRSCRLVRRSAVLVAPNFTNQQPAYRGLPWCVFAGGLSARRLSIRMPARFYLKQISERC
jgi:hypothetical protein